MESLPRTLGALRSAPSPTEAKRGAAVGSVEDEAHRSLILAAQGGDDRAFATIVELYQRSVYAFLRARLIEPADAEDLCQEVFLRCYLGRERLSRAAAAGPWLIGIARNLLREHVRRLQRRKETAWTELCLELDGLLSEPVRPEHEALAHLPDCLSGLGPSAREAIELRYASGLRMAEIGTRMKRSEGAAKLLVHRAREALRSCLDGRVKATT
jgi:RNA polymerase sigma-70 factor (ECF subfamily)